MRTPNRLSGLGLCFLCLIGATGCSTTTNALWQRQVYHPAKQPSISLAFDPERQDILVRFDQQLNKSDVIEGGYWLFVSSKSAASPGASMFVADSDLASFNGLPDIPVFHSKKDLRKSDARGYTAFAGPKDSEFELWRDGEKIQTYQLPTYVSQCAPATPWRVALTPGAMTVDATVSLGKGTGKAIVVAAPYVGVALFYAGLGALEYYGNH